MESAASVLYSAGRCRSCDARIRDAGADPPGGDKVQAFPVKTGTINVYEDSDCDEIRTKVKGKNLVVTITGFEKGAYYGTYKQGGESGNEYLECGKICR